MMVYRFKALNTLGKFIDGELTGTKSEVLQSLQQQRLTILEIKLRVLDSLRLCVSKRELSDKVLAGFFEDLAIYLRTDVGLNKTLSVLMETTRQSLFQQALKSMREELQKGESLTRALESCGTIPWMAVSIVDAGEKSGRLIEVLELLGRYYQRQAEIKSKLMSSISYPAFVFVILIGLVFFISFQVVPAFEDLLPHNALGNPPALIMIGTSKFLVKFWPAVLLGGFWGVGYLGWAFSRQKSWLMEGLFKVPILGGIIKESHLASCFLNLSLLTNSGISLLAALDHIIRHGRDIYIMRYFHDCYKLCVHKGVAFHAALGSVAFFPEHIGLTIKKGEDNGKLNEYLEKIAVFFAQNVDKKVDMLMAMLHPALIMICALIIILLGLAFIQPIYSNLTHIAQGQ